jgi:bacterioferritin-associated ferredoxin
MHFGVASQCTLCLGQQEQQMLELAPQLQQLLQS